MSSRPRRVHALGGRVLALGIAVGLGLAGCASAPPKPTLTVFAAASLTAAFTEIAALDPTLDVRFTFDGSPALVDQLAGGAPADVLATADEATMTRALNAGLVAEPTVFAANHGVLIVPRGNPAGITGLDASLDGAKLVVCAPTVPCGAVARALAEEAGITLRPVSEEQNVTDVRGKVASGEADAGIVFATDGRAADGRAAAGKVSVIEVPGAERHATRYPIAETTETRQGDAARAFIDLVQSDAGQAVLAEYGFGSP